VAGKSLDAIRAAKRLIALAAEDDQRDTAGRDRPNR
jgi:hypothetical protein